MDYYLQKSYYKTAALISNSCKAVAVLAGQTAEVATLAYQYGKHLVCYIYIHTHYLFLLLLTMNYWQLMTYFCILLSGYSLSVDRWHPQFHRDISFTRQRLLVWYPSSIIITLGHYHIKFLHYYYWLTIPCYYVTTSDLVLRFLCWVYIKTLI